MTHPSTDTAWPGRVRLALVGLSVVALAVAGCGQGEGGSTAEQTVGDDFVMATNTTTIGLRVAVCGIRADSYVGCDEDDGVAAVVEDAEDNGFDVELDLSREAFSLDVTRDEELRLGMDVEQGKVRIRCEGESEQCRDNGEFGVDGGALETLERVLREAAPGT